MDNIFAVAEIVGAILAAMGLAMWLEWLTLNGLMHVMPGRRDPRDGGNAKDERIGTRPRGESGAR